VRSGIKYCFKPVDGKYPEIDWEELEGDKDSGGFLDILISMVNDERRKAFFNGYYLGASDVAHDLGEIAGKEFDVDKDLNTQGAWRNWEVMEK
jgi:hypothetical protein